MENENLKTVKELTPFTKMIMTIGTLPSSFYASMSYYESMVWLYEYLKNEVIPTVNNNAEELKETQQAIIDVYNNLKYYIDHYFDEFDIQTQINNKLDEMAEDGTLTSILQSFQIEHSHVDLTNKQNLLENSMWTSTTGWSITTGGFTHSSGSATTLSTSVQIEQGAMYVLKFTCTNQYASTTEQALVVDFGNSGTFEQYRNDGTVTKWFTFFPENGNLIFTPSTNWSGDLTDIALYKIDETDKLESTLKIFDQYGNPSFSTIVNDQVMHNYTLSNNALQYATESSTHNIVIGENALDMTATPYYNTAIGYNSQHHSINGTRNVSVGFNSLYDITNGDRNIAIGTFALHRVTTGRNNVGIGADTAWYTTTGNNNIAISNGALNANTSGSQNIALGYFSNAQNTTGSNNISLGYMSNAYNTTGVSNIALGYMTHYKGTTDRFNVAIGQQIMTETPTNAQSDYNIGIGYQALNKSIGSNNIGIGNLALKGGTTNQSSYNIAVGYDVMSQTINPGAEGDNIVLGHSSGRKIAGMNNIVLGRGALNAECGNNNIALGISSLSKTTGASNIGIGLQSGTNITTGQKNTCIGHAVGSNITTANNVILIGHDISGINEDGYISIGDKIYSRYGNIGLAAAPSTEATVTILGGTTSICPIKINSGVLRTTPVAGCIEYDGSHLYFTDSTGSRHQISVES